MQRVCNAMQRRSLGGLHALTGCPIGGWISLTEQPHVLAVAGDYPSLFNLIDCSLEGGSFGTGVAVVGQAGSLAVSSPLLARCNFGNATRVDIRQIYLFWIDATRNAVGVDAVELIEGSLVLDTELDP